MTSRRGRRPFTGDERIALRQQAAALYQAGHTVRCVAGQIDRPWTTTHELLEDADVTFRPRGVRCTAGHLPQGAAS